MMMRTFLLLFICFVSLSSFGQAQTVFKDGKITSGNNKQIQENNQTNSKTIEQIIPENLMMVFWSKDRKRLYKYYENLKDHQLCSQATRKVKSATGETIQWIGNRNPLKDKSNSTPPKTLERAAWTRYEVFKRNLSCPLKSEQTLIVPVTSTNPSDLTSKDDWICENAVVGNPPRWRNNKDRYVIEAKRRGLSCNKYWSRSKRKIIDGIPNLSSPTLSNLPACPSDKSANRSNCFGTSTYANGDKYVGEYKYGKRWGQGTYTFGPNSKWAGDKHVGEYKDGERDGQGTYTYANGDKYVGEYKDGDRNGQGTYTHANGHVKEGIWKNNKFQYAKKLTPSTVPSTELTAAQREADELRKKLAALEAEQQQEQQRIYSDTQIPLITASSRRDSETNALIVGKVTDNVEVAEVTVDGEPVRLSSSGSFQTSFYVPRSGKTIEIVAFDSKGNKATKSIKLERGAIQQATGPVFANLNPSGKRVSQNKDALALIIGVSDYERTPAKAAYADKDAQTFYDYAMLKLGIPASNIKELVNVDANRIDVSLAVKDWIARTTKRSRSDVYVFFAGHGLADQTGKEMYLLPHDGEPRLLSESSISRNELFSDIAAANPRSVTVFLDTCYSGTTRGTDMLVASRPIAIRAKQQNIPDGFTVFTAAGGDQTAKPLEEAKHGMFSYFLMKGMEGDADSNQDNQITAAELHEYVEQNVVQQSGGSQVPELQGDAGRVLVRFQ